MGRCASSRSSGGDRVIRSASTIWRESRSCRSDRKSTRLNSSHSQISYAVFCLKKKKQISQQVSAKAYMKTHYYKKFGENTLRYTQITSITTTQRNLLNHFSMINNSDTNIYSIT